MTVCSRDINRLKYGHLATCIILSEDLNYRKLNLVEIVLLLVSAHNAGALASLVHSIITYILYVSTYKQSRRVQNGTI